MKKIGLNVFVIFLMIALCFCITNIEANSQFVSASTETNEVASLFSTEIFGDNVLVFSPKDNPEDVMQAIETTDLSSMQNHYTEKRLAILFMPGEYDDNINVPVGYYTTVSGLGYLPTDTDINSVHVSSGGTLVNFWRGVENLRISDRNGTTFSVSQATFFRRNQVDGNLKLTHAGGGSGGFIADSKINGTINAWLQQQWFTRNSYFGKWSGVEFNYTFMGNNSRQKVNDNWLLRRTVIDNTPIIREKPFLVYDEEKGYGVYVSETKENSVGVSWETELNGKFISLEDNFYIAKSDRDTVVTMQDALNNGKHLLLTPGIYELDAPLRVNNPNTIILGMGMATLVGSPKNQDSLMKVADVDGVQICGILFDANNTAKLLEVGSVDSQNSHRANPILLADLAFRAGGASDKNTHVNVCVEINANDTIADNFWVWRADHGKGVGWEVNRADNGLIVNGDNVYAYCMMVEHFQEYQTIWRGNGGYLAFYQSECPYDAPTFSDWSSEEGKFGYASYKVDDSVTSHYAVAIGVYSHNKYVDAMIESGFKTPERNGVIIKNAFIEKLAAGFGGIKHVINDKGGSTGDMQWFISIRHFENGIVKDGIVFWYLPLICAMLNICIGVMMQFHLIRRKRFTLPIKITLPFLNVFAIAFAIIFKIDALSITFSVFAILSLVYMLISKFLGSKKRQNVKLGHD